MSQTFGLKAITAAGWAGSGLVGSGLTWLVAQEGINLNPSLVLLLTGAGFIGGIAFIYVHNRYAAIVARSGPHERADYNKLRHTLNQGGLPAQIYSARLQMALNAVDRFFGDAGTPYQTLFPHAFGLRAPSPLWTAPAFDRCLLLALIYPITAIFITWVASGHIGPAEHALLLPSGLPGWRRLGTLITVVATCYCAWHAITSTLWKSVPWAIATFAGAVAGSYLGAPIVNTGIAYIVLFLGAVRGDVGVGSVVGVITMIVSFAVAFTYSSAGKIHFTLAGISALAVIVAISVAVESMTEWAADRGKRGKFQIIILIALAMVCLGATIELGRSAGWPFAGPLLLFVGLLSLLNAPFDWASLGLTRALLRRGLELGGWFPYALAMADAMAAAVIIAVLTVVSVLGVQAFDTLAAFSGGNDARLLPLNVLFDGIENNPAAPEYWWVYAMLLSTMIPSLINLMIGGASLMRGMPWLTVLLLYKMPEQGGPRRYDRAWITLLLTLQVFLGALLGVAAQAALAYLVIGWLLPPVGLDLLDLARVVAAPDLPGKAMTAIFGPPLH